MMGPGKYTGSVWGELPADYPTGTAEATYRGFLDGIGSGTQPARLMGMGFKGAAYRFRASAEYDEAYTQLIEEHGPSPSVEEHYRQDRNLFGFFVSGLAAIESFAFALHALGGHYAPASFLLDANALRKVRPTTLSAAYAGAWPDHRISAEIQSLTSSSEYERWKRIRNVLGHRAVPTRAFYLRAGRENEAIWNVEAAGVEDADGPLAGMTGPKREWLAGRLRDLWDALSKFEPGKGTAAQR